MKIIPACLKSTISDIRNAVTPKNIEHIVSNTSVEAKKLSELDNGYFSGAIADIKNTKIFTSFDFFKEFKGDYAVPSKFYKMVQSKDIKHIVNSKVGHELLQETKTLTTVDKIVNALRQIDGTYNFAYPSEKPGATFVGTKEIHLPELRFNSGISDITVHKKLGTGVFGNVYNLSIGDKKYALKVFTDPNRVDVHGAIGEIGTELSLNNQGICDKTEFYAANAQNGWMLTELADKAHYDLSKRGNITLEEYLNKSGLGSNDLYGPNTQGGLVIDIGGIHSKRCRTSSFEEFKSKYNNPFESMMAGRDAVDEKQFSECFNHPESRAQVARATRDMYDAKLQYKLLDKALDYKESATAAIFEATEAKIDVRFKLFEKALTKPEARIEAAKMIDSIPQKQRLDAFYEAWKYKECRPMLGKSLYTMEDSSQYKKMYDTIMNSDSAGAKLSYLSLKDSLTPEEKSIKQESLKQYFELHELKLCGLISN